MAHHFIGVVIQKGGSSCLVRLNSPLHSDYAVGFNTTCVGGPNNFGIGHRVLIECQEKPKSQVLLLVF